MLPHDSAKPRVAVRDQYRCKGKGGEILPARPGNGSDAYCVHCSPGNTWEENGIVDNSHPERMDEHLAFKCQSLRALADGRQHPVRAAARARVDERRFSSALKTTKPVEAGGRVLVQPTLGQLKKPGACDRAARAYENDSLLRAAARPMLTETECDTLHKLSMLAHSKKATSYNYHEDPDVRASMEFARPGYLHIRRKQCPKVIAELAREGREALMQDEKLGKYSEAALRARWTLSTDVLTSTGGVKLANAVLVRPGSEWLRARELSACHLIVFVAARLQLSYSGMRVVTRASP